MKTWGLVLALAALFATGAALGQPDCVGGAWREFKPTDGLVFEFGDPAGPRPRFRAAQLDARTAANPALAPTP